MTLVESRLFSYLDKVIQMKVKKAQVTKKDVEALIAWIEAQEAGGKPTNTKDYPEFTKVLEEFEDRPLVWQIKKSIAYRGALNYRTKEYYKLNPGESYVDICGSMYIQIDKEVLDGADPRRKDMKLLFTKVTKASDFYASYSSIPPKHVDFEEYPQFHLKSHLRPKSDFINPYDMSDPTFGAYATMRSAAKETAANKDVNRPKVDIDALGDFKEWL